MRRLILAVVLVLAFTPSARSQTLNWSADLSPLNLGGTVIGVQAFDLDGRPGVEYLVKVLPPNTLPFSDVWTIVVPTASGLCIAGQVTLQQSNFGTLQYLVDTDGDGRMEYLAFDQATQTLRSRNFDLSACET